jgi:hypothetical protein
MLKTAIYIYTYVLKLLELLLLHSILLASVRDYYNSSFARNALTHY